MHPVKWFPRKLILLIGAEILLALCIPKLANANSQQIELRGTYLCGPALTGVDPKEFADLASITIHGKDLRWSRNNAVLEETASGTLNEGGGVTLIGTGQRKDGKGQGWVIRISGKFLEGRFEGTGFTESPDGKVKYRECVVFMDSPLRTTLDYIEKGAFGSTTIKLEAAIFQPKKSNGRVVIFSHGSSGGKPAGIKISYSYIVPAIAKPFVDNGYIVVMWMRKGRGDSEGRFTEEIASCDIGSFHTETKESGDQLDQVISQVKGRFGVKKVILMGHSRGGFLSSTYAAARPEDVSHVINLAGGWKTACELRARFNREKLEWAARTFGNQYWIYPSDDSYFAGDKFGDPEHEWLGTVARDNRIVFRRIGNGGFADGHLAPLYKPGLWNAEVLRWLHTTQ